MTNKHLGKSVEEGAWEAFAATALVQRVLTGEDACAVMLNVKSASQLGHKHLTAVIQTGVEAFQH